MTTKEKLFNENKGLIFKVIKDNFKTFEGTGYHEDLISEGCVALLRTIDIFDSSRGFSFATIAYKNIYYTIRSFIDIKIYQKKKTSSKVIDAKGNSKACTVLLGAEIFSYNIKACNNDGEQDELINFHQSMLDEEKGYERIENEILLDTAFEYLKQMENTGQQRYTHIYKIALMKYENIDTSVIASKLNISPTTVNHKFRLALELIKKEFAAA